MTVEAFARHLCHLHGAKLRIRSKPGNEYGEVDLETRTITIRPGRRSRWLGTLFHELGHLYAMERGIYPIYHKPHCSPAYAKRFAYLAECKVDEIGAYLMSCYFPDETYEYWYRDNEEKAMKMLSKMYGFSL